MIRWLFSKAVREAVAMRKHVQRLLNAQRDILSPQAIAGVQVKIDELNAAIAEGNKGRIRIKAEELQFDANKWLKPYPHAVWRENVEVLLVALAVAMGIRTFFLQPFKIPTGSMQPTLFGITSENIIDQPDVKIPTGLERIKEWLEGISYVHVVAQADGVIDGISSMKKILIFNTQQSFSIGGVEHTIWFPPDFGEAPPGLDPLVFRARLEAGHFYHKGDDVIRLRMHTGDHLFVDRLSYNFSRPKRGDIVVFATQGIEGLPPNEQGTFYIKRLVGLGGETLSIQQDGEVENVPGTGTVPVGHLVVNGQPLSASTPHFKNLYGAIEAHEGQVWNYQDNQYYGHGMLKSLEPGDDFQVETNHYFVMGDNTMNSSDSRYWGDFSTDHVIGKSFFVYWPLTGRFGLDNQ